MDNLYETLEQALKTAGSTYAPYVVQRHVDTLVARGLVSVDRTMTMEQLVSLYVEGYARYRAANVPEEKARLMAVSDVWRVAYHQLEETVQNES